MSFTIRQATRADADAAYDLFVASAKEQDLDKWISGSREAFIADIGGANPPTGVYLAFQDTNPKPIGFVCCTRVYSLYRNKHNIFMRSLYVVPEARRNGVATFILGFAAQLAINEGASLYWDVQGKNKAAQAFYARHGCEIDPDGLLYYDAEREELAALSRHYSTT